MCSLFGEVHLDSAGSLICRKKCRKQVKWTIGAETVCCCYCCQIKGWELSSSRCPQTIGIATYLYIARRETWTETKVQFPNYVTLSLSCRRMGNDSVRSDGSEVRDTRVGLTTFVVAPISEFYLPVQVVWNMVAQQLSFWRYLVVLCIVTVMDGGFYSHCS